ncbi:MAG TPA: pyruvate formate lyase family protein, partial [Dehalococcoidales bacterium]|nr:pyruvate formate lyase family protein [Dehalococcoidales bacterium]
MTVKTDHKLDSMPGSWQLTFKRTCSDRVQKAIKRALSKPEICLERARAEIKAYEQYKDEPRVVQRARVLETYLRDKTVLIHEGELIVGNVTSKVRGSPIFPEPGSTWMEEEFDDPEKDPAIRKYDKHIITPEERKELRQVIFPYWRGKTLENHVLAVLDAETREKTFPNKAACPHIPQLADRMAQQDAGQQMTNYEKVLNIGLNGIKKEVQWYLAQLDQPYAHFDIEKKRDFYKACLISLDAAIDYANRYADLAEQLAEKESKPKRKAELKRIAEVCRRVPAEPARDWWEALQSVWLIHVIIHCEWLNIVNSFGRFDQYMYPFYKKTVIDDKTMTRDEALELLECFWVKTAEHTALMSSAIAKVQSGSPTVQTVTLGGQTRDGKDATNDLSWLCLEAEEQVGLNQPDITVRIWKESPDDFLKKAAEVVRLGRGKPKFNGDSMALKVVAKGYPGRSIEDYREYAIKGCVEIILPGISNQGSFHATTDASKIVELILNNGKCALCGKQIGPVTGDPRHFESMEAIKQAFRENMFYWTKYLGKACSLEMKIQAERMMGPFSSSLLEGPLPKGLDLIQGGAWETTYGVYVHGTVDAADSLGVIDRLIFRDKKVTWDELLTALKANWKGYEDLRQLCVHGVTKYGNDNDCADSWVSFVMDTYADAIDWLNTQKELLPNPAGRYVASILSANGPAGFGEEVGALPNGRTNPKPLSDTLSPGQGMDNHGPTAVIKSVAKVPMHRLAMGGTINQRLSPQMLETDRDLDNFVSFLKSVEELGIYEIQFNILSSDMLRKAMKEPDNYRDLMVRVASYCSYFVELDPVTQKDIITRTEQSSW